MGGDNMLSQYLVKVMPVVDVAAAVCTLGFLVFIANTLLAPLRHPCRQDFSKLMRTQQLRVRVTAMRPLLNYFARMRISGPNKGPNQQSPQDSNAKESARWHMWL